MSPITLAPGTWSPDVHQQLLTLLEQSGDTRRVAVFDLDDTLIAGDIGLAMLRTHDRRMGTSWISRYEELLAAEGRAAAYPAAALWFEGWTPTELNALCTEVAHQALETGVIQPRPEMRNLIACLHASGWEVWVCSASLEPAVVVMARTLGISADRVLGMALEVGSDGRYVGRLAGPPTYEAGKAETIRSRIGEPILLSAGDSRNDREMLCLARHAIFIEHGDPHETAYARSRGWWIQSNWPSSPAEHTPTPS